MMSLNTDEPVIIQVYVCCFWEKEKKKQNHIKESIEDLNWNDKFDAHKKVAYWRGVIKSNKTFSCCFAVICYAILSQLDEKG